MLDRRQMLAAAAAALASPVPAFAQQTQGQRLVAVLEAGIQRAMLDSPQLMTLTGLDVGANAAARSRLDDRSPAGVDRTRALFAEMEKGLAAFDPKTLSGVDLINYRSAAYLAATTLQSFSFPYGDPNVGVAIPYIVSQLSGAYRSTPSFLATQHPIETASDA